MRPLPNALSIRHDHNPSDRRGHTGKIGDQCSVLCAPANFGTMLALGIGLIAGAVASFLN